MFRNENKILYPQSKIFLNLKLKKSNTSEIQTKNITQSSNSIQKNID